METKLRIDIHTVKVYDVVKWDKSEERSNMFNFNMKKKLLTNSKIRVE